MRLGLRMGLAAVIAAASSGGGCATERAPIGRVQPNALSKHFFVGAQLDDATDDPEFRYRGYVIDGSASQSMLGVGSWAHLDRIKWEVTETMLIARKSYAIADGRDLKGAPVPKRVNDGTVVAAYPITSHFDVRHAYNTTTGEELNVVEENTTDRPWYAREYMRVDWSKNLVTNNPMWGDFFFGQVFGKDMEMTPVQYTVTDPSDDDAVHFESDYFDITTKYYLDPSQSYFARWNTSLPTCAVYGIFTGSGTYECDAQEALVRWSFAKVDPDEDFEPLENTWAPDDVVGNPGGGGDSLHVGIETAPRQSYDPQYGYTDDGLHRYANIHNLWKASHQKHADGSWVSCDSNADADGNGTADSCENAVTGYPGASGSQCDLAMKKCTIPYRDRELKTVAYWVNADAPKDLLDAVDEQGTPVSGLDPKGLPGFAKERGTIEDLLYSWNQLLRNGPAFAKEVECRRTGDGDRDSCHAQFFESDGTPANKEMVSFGNWLVDVPKAAKGSKTALTICHNPVRPYDDHDACGDTGTVGRLGDVRKNFVFYWAWDSRAPWGGIANWEGDPLTGQAFGNAAQIMGRSATFAAALERDIIQLAIGDIKLEDIIDNTAATTFAKRLDDGRTPALTQEEIDKRVASIDLANLRLHTGGTPLTGTQEEKAAISLKSAMNATNSPILASTAILESESYMQKLRGSTMESQLADKHWMVSALGASDAMKASERALDFASPLRGMDPGKMRMISSWFGAALHERGVCFMDDGNEAPVTGSVYMPGLAGYFKAKYGSLSAKERGERIYQDLWKETVKGIALHEIGHSLGMFHNFASSWDAQNYNPQYWQLRTNESKATKSCAGAPRTGDADTCMGPRYLDPETADEAGLAGESRPAIEYFGNSSTMEYQLERFGETVGLGTFDYHTMKALYGRVIDTFDDKVFSPTAQKGFKYRTFTQLDERDIILGGSSESKHYTETARLMKTFDSARDCRAATDEEKAVGNWRVVHGKVCSPPPKDVWKWSEFKSDELQPGMNGVQWHTGDKLIAGPSDKHDRVRWQYRFGQSNNAYMHVNPGDSGADPYEGVLNASKRFRETYVWAYNRRKNREYNALNLPSRVSDTYFERIRSYHWQVATEFARGSDGDLENDDALRPYAMAEAEMVKLLSTAILAPEPGAYAASADRTPVDSMGQVFDAVSKGGSFTIGVPDGRYIEEDYDNDKGGSWTYLQFLNHPGFDMEKSLAMMALVDARPTLSTINRENWLDGRDPRINFRNDMPALVDRLVGGILSEDWETIAPHVADTSKPTPVYLDLAAANVVRPAGAKVLFPNVGYKTQLATAMWIAIFSRMSTDMTLVDKMRLWVEGALDAVTVDERYTVKFTDPRTGYTYVARKYGAETVAGKVVDKGISSRVIAHANAMLAAAYTVTLDGSGKPKVDAFGRPEVTLDADGQATIANTAAASKLHRYIGLIDAIRQIETTLTGPLGSSGGPSGGDDDSSKK